MTNGSASFGGVVLPDAARGDGEFARAHATATMRAAEDYIARGWRVLLLREGTSKNAKRPHDHAHHALRGTFGWKGLRDNPLTGSEVDDALTRFPMANIGIICGDGLAVADVDAEFAPTSLARLASRTPTATTPRGGMHNFLASPPGTRTRRLSWGELQADGAFVVAPPTSGREWLTPCNAPLKPLPDDLLTTINVPVAGYMAEGRSLPYTHSDMAEWGYEVLNEEWVLSALDVTGIEHRGVKNVRCPMHDDRRASAGVLQGASGWILTCRACQKTWGLAYVYASVRHQKDPRGPSLKMWWTRLLHETGALQLPEVAVEPPPDGSDAFRRVADGIVLATRVMLHNRHNQDTVGVYLAKSFAPAWCGVCESTFLKHKDGLVGSGWLTRVGPTADGRGSLWLPASLVTSDRHSKEGCRWTHS